MADKTAAYVKGFVEECFRNGVPEQHAQVLFKVACVREQMMEKQAGPVGLLLRGAKGWGRHLIKNPITKAFKTPTEGNILKALGGTALGVGLPAVGAGVLWDRKLQDWQDTMTKGEGLFGSWRGPVDKFLTWWKGDPLAQAQKGPGELPSGLARRYSNPSDSDGIPLHAGWGGEVYERPSRPSGPTAMGYAYDERARSIQALDSEIAQGEAITDPNKRREWELTRKPSLIARRDNLKAMQRRQQVPGHGNINEEIRKREEYLKELERRRNYRNQRLGNTNDGLLPLWDAEGEEERKELDAANRDEDYYETMTRQELEQLHRLKAEGRY